MKNEVLSPITLNVQQMLCIFLLSSNFTFITMQKINNNSNKIYNTPMENLLLLLSKWPGGTLVILFKILEVPLQMASEKCPLQQVRVPWPETS